MVGGRTTVELLSLEGLLVRGDVDPHGNGLGTCEANGGALVVEVRSSALLECLGEGVKDALVVG
jgi:hypothetical protein